MKVIDNLKLPPAQLLFLVLALILLSCTACSSRPTGSDTANPTTAASGTESVDVTTGTNADGPDLARFLQTVALPDKLTISFDPDTVETSAAARSYTARKQLFDVETVKQNLLRRAVIDSKLYAEGPWFETGDASFKEYLCVYHGVIQGGLTYSLVRDGVWLTTKLADVIVDEPGPEDYYGYGQYEAALKKSRFRSETDLPFMNFADVRAALLDLLQQTGFPEMAISETYTLDLATIEEQYDRFLEESAVLYPEREVSDYTWSETDTGYLFLMRQLIDQIPVLDQGWQGQGASTSPAGDPMPASRTRVYWTRDGMASIRAYSLYELLESGPEEPLIGPAQALQVLLADLSEIIISRPTWLASVELCYVSVPASQSKDRFTLLPAWVFCLGEELTIDGTDGQSRETLIDYAYVVIDAISGRKLSR